MSSSREQTLQGLFLLLKTALPDVKALRNESMSERIPAGGLIILRDGDPGQPEIMLSPLSYYWQHKASLEVLVQHSDQAVRDQKLDDLFQSIAAAIAMDRTLGGLCDRVTPEAPVVSTLATDGAPQIAAAIVGIELIYMTADQLG